MPIRSNRPEPKNPGEGGYWKRLDVPAGCRIPVTLAGPPLWVEVHFNGKVSKPCRTALTGGALACTHERCGKKREWRGYTPVWDADEQCRFVLLSELALHASDKLGMYAPCEVWRGPDSKDPLMIRYKPGKLASFVPPDGLRWPIDLTPTLLRVWKDEAVAEWVRANPGEAVPMVPGDTGVSPTKKKKKTRAEERATAPYPLPLPPEVPTEPPLLAEVFPNLLKKVANLKPSTNGDGAH